jgi:hypothetical protein
MASDDHNTTTSFNKNVNTISSGPKMPNSGSGSGTFHHYQKKRRIEVERVQAMERENAKEEEKLERKKLIELNQALAKERTEKNRARRKRRDGKHTSNTNNNQQSSNQPDNKDHNKHNKDNTQDNDDNDSKQQLTKEEEEALLKEANALIEEMKHKS